MRRCLQIQHSVNICIPAEYRGQTTAFQAAASLRAVQKRWERNIYLIWTHRLLCTYRVFTLQHTFLWLYGHISVAFRTCLTYSSPYAPSIKALAFTDRADMLQEIHHKTLNIPSPPARLAPGHLDVQHFIISIYLPATNALPGLGVRRGSPPPLSSLLTAVCSKSDVFYAFSARRAARSAGTLKYPPT